MKSSECSQQLQVAGEVMRGVGLRKVVPKEPRSPELLGGLWFFTEPGEGGWAAHLPEKQPPHPPQHSRRYGLLSSSPVPGTGQLY